MQHLLDILIFAAGIGVGVTFAAYRMRLPDETLGDVLLQILSGGGPGPRK
jgi:hypothetical protein